MDEYNVKIEGAHAVVLGRSQLVGKPIAQLLMSRNATVTQCHSRTKDIASYVKQADILVAAIGKASFVKRSQTLITSIEILRLILQPYYVKN